MAIAQQADGDLVVAGHAISANGDFDVALARLRGDGTLDPSFNGSGKVTMNFECVVSSPIYQITNAFGNDQVTAMAIQPDGKLLVGGGNCGDSYGFNSNLMILLNQCVLRLSA